MFVRVWCVYMRKSFIIIIIVKHHVCTKSRSGTIARVRPKRKLFLEFIRNNSTRNSVVVTKTTRWHTHTKFLYFLFFFFSFYFRLHRLHKLNIHFAKIYVCACMPAVHACGAIHCLDSYKIWKKYIYERCMSRTEYS